jgi:two-component system response regulator NreC
MPESSEAITVLLVDDHTIVRSGLRALLESENNFQIVGETGDGLEALRLVENLKPQVMVLDITIPALNGLEVTRQARRVSPNTRILVFSMHANEAYVLEALRNGAAGYALKYDKSSDILEAVRAVAAGRRYLSPPFTELAIEAYLQKAQSAARKSSYETLTTREREVLQLSAEGHTAAEIGARLFISPRTVEIHRAHLMRKLSLHNQADLILYALKKGLISSDPPPDL